MKFKNTLLYSIKMALIKIRNKDDPLNTWNWNHQLNNNFKCILNYPHM